MKNIFCLGLLLAIFSFQSQVHCQKDSINIDTDSLLKAFFKTSKEDPYSKSVFIQRTDAAYDILDEAKNVSTLGWQELTMYDQLQENRKILRVLRRVLKRHTNSEFRNLQLYHNMITEIRGKNERIGEYLLNKKEQILTSRKNILTIPNDTILHEMIKRSVIDTTTGQRRTKNLRKKWGLTEELIKTSLDSVNRWIGMVSMQSITTASLLQKTDSLMQQNSVQALKGDYPFLWKKQEKVVTPIDTSAGAQQNTVASDNKKVINYYVRKNISTILWLPLVVLVILYMLIRRQYKRFKRASPELLGGDQFLVFINRSRFLSALVISLSLFPLFDVHAPWFFLLINQFIIIGSVLFLFWQKERKGFLPVFFFLIAMLIGITVINTVEPGKGQRFALLGLNLISIATAFILLPRIKLLPQIKRTVRVITILYVVVNLLAIISNMFGRVIVAEGLTNAGIIGITQIITLSVFLQIFSETLYLQLAVSRIKRNIKLSADYMHVLQSVNKPVFVFTLVIWCMMFFANIYMYEMIEGGIVKILTSGIHLGSLSFTIGNVALFFIVIWIAHLLQKYIGAFFGDADMDEDAENKKGRSRMMIVKLVVLCAGYLVAVGVSGLPVDKITIIIGALGVGVGMGLQSIVNNFVSGVVLIFDRPLQIGDAIEVDGHSGKVKNIGIRASTILTDDGAEVIIPNGDILSTPIINWTLSNNQRRIILHFHLKGTVDKEFISQLVKDTIMSTEGVVLDKDPIMLFESIKNDDMRIKIFFWSSNAGKTDWLKSEVRYLLYGKFREKGITIL